MDAILEAIRKGNIDGFTPEEPEEILTDVSRVFVFKENQKALKLYRRDNMSFNNNILDLRSADVRKEFIKDDFRTNHAVNPEVYLKLHEGVFEGDTLSLRQPTFRDELIIEMKPIDGSQFLSRQLQEDVEISFESVGRQIGLIVKDLNIETPQLNTNFYALFETAINELDEWVSFVPNFSTEDRERCINYLKEYRETNRERFESIKDSEMIFSLDSHADNAIYENDKLSFLDIMQIKQEWRVATIDNVILYLGADIYALRDKESFDAYMRGALSSLEFDRTDEHMYLVYLTAIRYAAKRTLANADSAFATISSKYRDLLHCLLDSAEGRN